MLGDIVHTENVNIRTIDLLNDNITIEAALKLNSLAKEAVPAYRKTTEQSD